MGLKETFQKQGGMKLIKQYARSGSLGTAVGEFVLLGKSRTSLEILRLSTQLLEQLPQILSVFRICLNLR